MKFGETFSEYLHGDQECFLEKCSHVEYKKLKKVLKRCRKSHGSFKLVSSEVEDGESSQLCQCDSCPVCDEKFFSELLKEASEIAGCFNSRVRRLLHLHMSSGVQKCMLQLFHCFRNDEPVKIQQVHTLIEYATMNAIAIRKILKKYDKVHSSVNGRNFQLKMRSEHMELLQSPWLIELGAFCINFNKSSGGVPSEIFCQFSCDLSAEKPVMTFKVSDSVELEYGLTCAICLDTVFNPYSLACGHLFCKLCACSAASVMIFEGLKAAPPESKCPVCREVGVYATAVHMTELDLLLKHRCKDSWRERWQEERAEMVKQSKEFWDSQTKSVLGI